MCLISASLKRVQLNSSGIMKIRNRNEECDAVVMEVFMSVQKNVDNNQTH